MGNFADDTTVDPVDLEAGRYRARFSKDWEIWGPNGGYVAAIALRAAGAHSSFPRPASFACTYLSVGAFDDVDLTVTSLRRTKRAECLRVSMSQADKLLVEALAWTVDDGLDGLVHDTADHPGVAHHSELKTFEEWMRDENVDAPRFKFWENMEGKPLVFFKDWANRPAGKAQAGNWYRFRPQATFDDPYVDAARALLHIDTTSWPAATRASTGELPYIAPSLDVVVRFHRASPQSEWLLVLGDFPVAEDGLIGGWGKVYDEDFRLLASGGSQLLCRKI